MAINAVTNSSAAQTQTLAGAAGKKLSESFDTFLTLLTKQLQNQDPTAPLDTNAFTQQLVSFTGVEQSIQQNQNLEKVIGLLSSQGLNNATGYLGKTVSLDSATVALGDHGATWKYATAADGDVELTVKNSAGKIVFTTGAFSGVHDFKWDGKDANGNPLPKGNYTLSASAKSAAGTDIATQVAIEGKVSSVDAANGEVQLIVAGTPYKLSQILSVTDTTSPQQAAL